jgi:hypothetical protein
MAQETQRATRDHRGVGWVYFAGLLLMLSGIFHAITGLVAIFKDQIYLVNEQTLLVLGYGSWGWLHLILGIALIIVSFSLMAGSIFGRVVGVMFATVSAIVNFAFISAYPLWSILIILLDILVVYGILVHGSAARTVPDKPAKPAGAQSGPGSERQSSERQSSNKE